MRKAKESDYWDKVYKRKFPKGLKKVNLNGLNNMSEITFPDGIIVICGLNGAGKSTIISAIKDIIGLPLSDHDTHKINKITIQGEFKSNSELFQFSNEEGNRLSDKGVDISNIQYLDCNESTKSQNFIIKQANFEELIEQIEEYGFSGEEVEEINYLTGKQYISCGVSELEDIEEIGVVPYFRVAVAGAEYDSRGMGSGEHFL